jgi:hypothetical protein
MCPVLHARKSSSWLVGTSDEAGRIHQLNPPARSRTSRSLLGMSSKMGGRIQPSVMSH